MNINLLEFIKALPTKTYKGHGTIVGFDEIFVGLERQIGFNNQDVLAFKLIELEKIGHLKIHRDINDVIVGVSI